MPSTTNVSMRVDTDLLHRIDHSALQHGQSRTEYILSWLPDTYTAPPNPTPTTNAKPTARHADSALARLLASSQQG